MMKTDQAKKVIIKVDPDVHQENVKNTRRGLKTLQPAAADKENLAGRPHIFKDSKLALENQTKKPKPLLMHKGIQTEKYITTIEDLTGDEASVEYWQRVAEKKQESLYDSLFENEKLKDQNESLKDENETLKGNVGALQEENKVLKEMLEESKHLVEVLQEMISETETEDALKEESERPEEPHSENDSS